MPTGNMGSSAITIKTTKGKKMTELQSSFYFFPMHIHRSIFMLKHKWLKTVLKKKNYGSCFDICLNMTIYKICRVPAAPLQPFSSEYNLNTKRTGGAL